MLGWPRKPGKFRGISDSSQPAQHQEGRKLRGSCHPPFSDGDREARGRRRLDSRPERLALGGEDQPKSGGSSQGDRRGPGGADGAHGASADPNRCGSGRLPGREESGASEGQRGDWESKAKAKTARRLGPKPVVPPRGLLRPVDVCILRSPPGTGTPGIPVAFGVAFFASHQRFHSDFATSCVAAGARNRGQSQESANASPCQAARQVAACEFNSAD